MTPSFRAAVAVAYGAVRRLTEAAARVAAACVVVSLALVSYSVALRYFFGRPEPWIDEAVGYVLVALVTCAAAEALRRGEHISVDLVTERLGPKPRRAIECVGLLAVLAVGVILAVQGWEMVAFSKMVGIRSIGYLEIEIWTVQLFVPLGGVLLGLAALAELLRIAAGLPGEAPTAPHGVD